MKRFYTKERSARAVEGLNGTIRDEPMTLHAPPRQIGDI